jgi:hypothetical protein
LDGEILSGITKGFFLTGAFGFGLGATFGFGLRVTFGFGVGIFIVAISTYTLYLICHTYGTCLVS